MALLLDIIIIALMLIYLCFGYSKGLVKTLFGFLRSLGAFILAFIFCDKFGAYINNRFVGAVVQSKVSKALTKIVGNAVGEQAQNKIDAYFEKIPSLFGKMLKSVDLTSDTVVKAVSDSTVDAATKTLAAPIAQTVSKLLAFIILFVGIIVAATLLSKIVELIFKLPVLSQVNHLCGLILGCMNGIINCFIFVALVSCIFPYFQSINFLGAANVSLENTVIFKYLSQINPINQLF